MASSVLKIASANINSVNKSMPYLLPFLRLNKIDILFLQETHRINPLTLEPWLRKHKLYFLANAPTNKEADSHFKGGTAILMKVTTKNSLRLSSFILVPNRIQTLSFELNNQIYLLINLYLHSGKAFSRKTSRKEILDTLALFLQNQSFHFLILLGDFNMVLDQRDTSSKIVKGPDTETLQSILNSHNLSDTFRNSHPLQQMFSYKRTNTGSRIDRIYASDTLLRYTGKATYLPLHFSDHASAPFFEIRLASPLHSNRNTFWKLNNSLLSSSNHKEQFTYFLDKWVDKPLRLLHPLLWWERFKKQLRFFFQGIGSMQAKFQISKMRSLQKALQSATYQQIAPLSKQIQNIQLHWESGAFVRSKELIPNDNETPTREFFQIERKKQQNTMIDTLRVGDQTITDPEEIKEHISSHFQNRWNQPISVANTDLKQYLSDIPTLQEDALSSDHKILINTQEIQEAIQSLRCNTSPGSDGLTPLFYRTFQHQLIPRLLELYNNMFLQNTAPPSHKLAVIKLIPKPGSKMDVNNWRPISLLNCDYKILAKIISLRLMPLLSSYISDSQQAGIQGRQIHHTLLNIKSAIDYSTDIDQPLALLQLDFSKAFDSVSHSFLIAVMQHIKVPPYLIKWISILLNNLIAKIQINHSFTESFPINTGIRQGCPLSMLLFTLATDVLAKKIHASPYIRGLKLGTCQLKIQQYADDTTLLLCDSKEIKPALEIVRNFTTHSNLKLNTKKTTILSNSNTLIQEAKRNLPNATYAKEVRILGLLFSSSKDMKMENWKRTVIKIKTILDKHRHRTLSMFGKLAIIKTLILPHLTFTARIFLCPLKINKQIQTILHKFLWYPFTLEPINREILKKIPQHGGIGMPCITAWTNTALLIRVKTLFSQQTPNHFWTIFGLYNLSYHIRKLDPSLFSNSRPQRPEPNPDWKTILELSGKQPIKKHDWQEMNHKQLYHHLLQSVPHELPKLNSRSQPTSWAEILLLSKPYRGISNKQKEIIFKVAHSGFFFGKFNSNHNITTLPNGQKRFNACKFCQQNADKSRHVFYECHVSRKILLNLQAFIFQKTKQKLLLNMPIVLYNVCQTPANLKPSVLRLLSVYRIRLLEEKLRLDSINCPVQNVPLFIQSLTDTITSETNHFFDDEEIPEHAVT